MSPVTCAATASRRARRWRLIAAMSVLAAFGAAAGQVSLALFTDQESVDATFATGTIDLDSAKIAALSLSVPALMPGDTITDDVVVHNVGSAELRYAMASSSTNADSLNLRDVLTLSVRETDATTPGTPCNDFDGATVVTATALGTSSGGFGDPAVGPQAGDRVLTAGAQETLCFRVSLPLATGAAYEGATTTTTFTFDAEQTANNS